MGRFYVLPYLKHKTQLLSFNDVDCGVKIHRFLYNNLSLSKNLIIDPDTVNKPLTNHEILNSKRHVYKLDKFSESIASYDSNKYMKSTILKEIENIDSSLNSLLFTDCDLINFKSINSLINKNDFLKDQLNNCAFDGIYFSALELSDSYIDLNLTYFKNLPYKTSWLIDIVTFFKEVTELELLFNESDLFDYFLFDKNGNIKYFIGFNCIKDNDIYLDESTKNDKILEHNLKMFKSFLTSFMFYYHNDKKYRIFSSSPILKVYDRLRMNKFRLKNFDDINYLLQSQGGIK